MQSLKAIQESFYSSVFNEFFVLEDNISSSHALDRFNIYKNTIFENMKTGLKITYPGIWKLLGEECANSCAYAYCSDLSNLPTTGCLDDFGSSFSSFLGNIKELGSLPYIKDYAAYEWLKHLAYNAEEKTSINPLELQNISEDNLDEISFVFISSLHTFSSIFSIENIQSVVEDENASEIVLKTGHYYGVIFRSALGVETHWVSRNLWLFIDSLKNEANLSAAIEKLTQIDSNFNLLSSLQFLIEKKLIHKIIIHEDGNDN